MYIKKERYDELIELAVGCQMFMDVLNDTTLTDSEKVYQMKFILEIKKEQKEKRNECGEPIPQWRGCMDGCLPYYDGK